MESISAATLYPIVKSVHVSLVMLSGTLFTARGVNTLLRPGSRWLIPARWWSVVIDTSLLLAALGLLVILRLNPFVVPWLAMKLALLVAYIVLGALALKRARTMPVRVACFALALVCFAAMYAVARSHDPLGFLDWLPATISGSGK